ncbi:DUF4158 domain-containing protein [Escherichia coli]
MGSCAAPSAKGDDKFITTDYLQQCPRTHRRSHNRLGFAIQLALVRDLGRTLRAGEIPPEAVITVVAEQLDIDPAVLALLQIVGGDKLIIPFC